MAHDTLLTAIRDLHTLQKAENNYKSLEWTFKRIVTHSLKYKTVIEMHIDRSQLLWEAK